MGIKYYPVIMHIDEFRRNAKTRATSYDNAIAGADRFEKLNGVRPQVISIDDMNRAGITCRSMFWYPFYIWDIVPEDIEYVLYMNSYMLAAHPLPELPPLKFAAARDRHDRENQGKTHSEIVKQTGKYYQGDFWIGHRDIRPYFDEMKPLGEYDKYNEPDHRGFDQRGYMTPLNEAIQANFPVYELSKEWNWIIAWEKRFYTNNPYMINFNGWGTWAYWKYIYYLLDQVEALSATQK